MSFAANETVAEAFNVMEGVKVIITMLLTMSTTEVSVEYYSERSILHRYDLDFGRVPVPADLRVRRG